MALNIPNTGAPGEGFLKGLESGGSLFQKIMNARYNNSLHPSGDVANAMYVEQLKNLYGENDPRYLSAKRAHDMAILGRQSLIDYRGNLNQTAGIRFTSPLGRELAEGQGRGALDILNNKAEMRPVNGVSKEGEQWYDKQGNPVYSDENPRTEQERKAYEAAIAKRTTDAAIRNKIPYAENVKITMDNINPEDLVQFSGPSGTIKLAIESLKAARGNPSPEYLAYQTSLTGAKTLKKQLRQFWGDSIQPAATEEIGKLTNPSHWTKNPQVALQQFNQLKKITDQELASFTSHGTSPVKLNYDKKSGEFYTDKSGEQSQNKSSLQQKIESSGITQQDKNYAQVASGQLIDVMPKATPENIIATARATNKSINEVVEHLVQQAERLRGGQ